MIKMNNEVEKTGWTIVKCFVITMWNVSMDTVVELKEHYTGIWVCSLLSVDLIR